MKFIEYILIESDLEDLYVSDDATENIELLHEMEWKLGQIIENEYRFNPKMYVNLIRRFSNLALDSYEDLSEKFDRLFEYWLDKHQIDNSNDWARMVYQENEDMIESEGVACMGGHCVNMEQIVQGLDNSELIRMVEYEWGSIAEGFPNEYPYYLQSIEAVPEVPPEELEDYAEPWDYWEDNEDEAADYVSNHNLEGEYAEHCIESLKDSGIDPHNFHLDEEAWVNGIENVLYPQYYGQHGYNIEAVTPDVEEARERLTLADELVAEAQSMVSKLHPDDADLDKYIERIKKIIGQTTSAISLAMGVVHTTGNIMQDYGHVAGLEDVDSDFLDGFHEREIDDWRDELKKIIR